MKVTYNWLKDFVEINIPAQSLAERLTMAGLEVVSLEEKDKDFIFEIEITSNRPDWLSVIGIAREVAAITGRKLKSPKIISHKVRKSPFELSQGKQSHKAFTVKIEHKKDCPLYTAKIIRDVKVRPSPEWLRKRLELTACRSINNIVDITNYILFTYGEPLHAFDLDKLNSDTIIVRRGKKGERMVTIGEETRAFDSDILVIADKVKPVAIAGILGGKETEVTEGTKNILLEAAIFNPVVIRRSRQRLGIQTDSSYRFERGIDPKTVESASLAAAKLIQGLAGGELILKKDTGLTKAKTKVINLGLDTVNNILGVTVGATKVKNILNNLGFKIRPKTKNNLSVGVPSYRPDVNIEIDLIEEIARIFGYQFIPKSLPSVMPSLGAGGLREQVALIKNILVGLGLNEVITYSLIDSGMLKSFGTLDRLPIEIQNPLSTEQEILRTTILPSLVKCVAYNLNQKQEYINIFEIAKAFSRSSESATKESLALGIALCGEKSRLLNQGRIKDEITLLDLKGVFEVLFERLGVKDYLFVTTGPEEAEICIGKKKVGRIVNLEKEILESFDIKNKNVLVAEVSLDPLLGEANLEKKFIELPAYPGISRDISLILKEEIPAGDILGAIRSEAGPLLKEIEVRDYYRGRQIPSGYRCLTISCFYRSDERTLTESEIAPVHTLICNVLTERLGSKIR